MEALRSQIPEDVPESLFMLAEQCISYDPSLRPDSEATRDWVQDIFESTPAADVDSSAGTTESAKSVQGANDAGKAEASAAAGATAASTESVDPETRTSLPAKEGGAAAKRDSGSANIPPLVMPPQILFAIQQLGGSKNMKTESVDLHRASFDGPASGSAFMGAADLSAMSFGVKDSIDSIAPVSYSSSFCTPTKSKQEQSLSMIRPAGGLERSESTAQDLFAKYGLQEAEVGGMASTPKSGKQTKQSFFADAEALVLKEGYLSKLNQTGFRNWKKIWFTLTDQKLSWKSNDPTKRCWFDLKHATITRSSKYRNRFIISQSVKSTEITAASSGTTAGEQQQHHQTNSRNRSLSTANEDKSVAAASTAAAAAAVAALDDTSEQESLTPQGEQGNMGNHRRRSKRHSRRRGSQAQPANSKHGDGKSEQQNQNIDENGTREAEVVVSRSKSVTAADSADARAPPGKNNRGVAVGLDHSNHRRSVKRNSRVNVNVNVQDSKQPHSVHHAAQHAILFQRELSSNDPKETEEWFHAIEEAILEANEEEVTEYTQFNYSSSRQTSFTRDQRHQLFDDAEGQRQQHFAALTSPGSHRSMLQLVGVKSLYEYDDVGDWLRATGLPLSAAKSYEQLFIEKGYGELSTIAQAGLTTADFEYLGITHPAHCRILEGAVCSHYSPTLRLAINGWSRYEDFFVFKVVSRWKFHRSSQYLKLSHFRKFDKALRRELASTEFHELLIRLPLLPIKDFAKHERDSKRLSVDFYSSLRRKLEIYLLSIAQVLHESPKLYVLLRFLELVHTQAS